MPRDNDAGPDGGAGRGAAPAAEPAAAMGGNGDNINIGGNNNTNNNNRTRNNNNQNPLINVRDRLFHALFFKAALAYARTFPRPVRRFLEFIVLLKAIAAFFVLAYIHVVFSRTPTNCLEHIKDDWPREGILRVEILRNGADDYNIEKSYAKEEKLRHENVGDLTSVLGILARDGFVNIEPSAVEEVAQEPNPMSEASLSNNNTLDGKILSTEVGNGIRPVEEESTKLRITNITEKVPAASSTVWDGATPEPEQQFVVNANETTQEDESLTSGKIIAPLKDSVSEVEKLVRAVWPEEEYIVENVVTGEHYRFVSMWMARTSYLAAFFIMLVFVSTQFSFL
ncbi:hypothetical protein C0J52_04256 [Blattella germanica]|nr:hypothetical protein C0J52_04256 [Blattella germanica]